MNCSTDDELFFNQNDLSSVISSLQSCNEIDNVMKNVKIAVDFLPMVEMAEMEDELLKYVFPIITQSLGNIFERNCSISCRSKAGVLEELQNNLQNSAALLDVCNEFLNHFLKFEAIEHMFVPSLPINVVKILDLTFGHCKSSQVVYDSEFKMMSELLELFKKAQNVHLNFLNLMENHLSFDCLADNEMDSLHQILEIMWKVSLLLSSMNLKSMGDNWRSFTNLAQRYSDILMVNSFDLKTPITKLIEELNNTIQSIANESELDIRKIQQNVKVTGFYIKIIMKLLDIYKNHEDYFGLSVLFLTTIHSYPKQFLQCDGSQSETKNLLFQTFQLSDVLLRTLMDQDQFLNTLVDIGKDNGQKLGVIGLLNKIVANFKKQLANKAIVVPICASIFYCLRDCSLQFFFDSNGDFYDSLCCNVATLILLSQNHYSEMEKLILGQITTGCIWASLFAIDVWCLVLRNCQETTVISIFNTLMSFLEATTLDGYNTIFLKLLTDRIFNLLPASVKTTEISKHANIWDVVSLNSIPLSQRFHIEFILNDIYEKVTKIDMNTCTEKDITSMVSSFALLSNVDFNEFGINTIKISQVINQMWAINSSGLLSNDFYKYYMISLSKLTKTNSWELSPNELLQVVNKLREMKNDPLCCLLLSEIMYSIVKRNFTDLQEVLPLLSNIADYCQDLLLDKNPVIVEQILRATDEMPHIFVNKITNSSPQTKQLLQFHSGRTKDHQKLDRKYLNSIRCSTFEHKCVIRESVQLRCEGEVQQPSKKIRIDDDEETDDLIDELKSVAKKLFKTRVKLSMKQRVELKNIASKLESFIAQ